MRLRPVQRRGDTQETKTECEPGRRKHQYVGVNSNKSRNQRRIPPTFLCVRIDPSSESNCEQNASDGAQRREYVHSSPADTCNSKYRRHDVREERRMLIEEIDVRLPPRSAEVGRE